MSPPLSEFAADRDGLQYALDLLTCDDVGDAVDLPDRLPESGIGAIGAIDALSGAVLSASRDLGAPGFFAHMDPPTPWITWALHQWIASRNQNLLHPDSAPAARDLEQRVVGWLAPLFAMSGGHMTPGSTLANLTALWAAREAGAADVVAGRGAYLSVKKAANLLAMPHRVVDDWSRPGDVRRSAVVLTAGTTSTGEIESLDAASDARWRHVDAAWAGPLRLSDRHAHLLAGIERADSVAVSAHKWMFQPKESALVLFRDVESAHASISVDAAYLSVANVGILGSHGAVAVPLLATLLAYGRCGVAEWIETTMTLADELWGLVEAHPDLEARSRPHAGVLCWRHRTVGVDAVRANLPGDVLVSVTAVDGELWLRSVAANPMADPVRVVDGVLAAARACR